MGSSDQSGLGTTTHMMSDKASTGDDLGNDKNAAVVQNGLKEENSEVNKAVEDNDNDKPSKEEIISVGKGASIRTELLSDEKKEQKECLNEEKEEHTGKNNKSSDNEEIRNTEMENIEKSESKTLHKNGENDDNCDKTENNDKQEEGVNNKENNESHEDGNDDKLSDFSDSSRDTTNNDADKEALECKKDKEEGSEDFEVIHPITGDEVDKKGQGESQEKDD